MFKKDLIRILRGFYFIFILKCLRILLFINIRLYCLYSSLFEILRGSPPPSLYTRNMQIQSLDKIDGENLYVFSKIYISQFRQFIIDKLRGWIPCHWANSGPHLLTQSITKSIINIKKSHLYLFINKHDRCII